MVTDQATQDDASSHLSPNDWQRSGDSVRITAQERRRMLTDFLRSELVRAQAIAACESNDLRVMRGNGQPCAQAELRASNATAVAQYLGSTLKAYSDNRDFVGQVTR